MTAPSLPRAFREITELRRPPSWSRIALFAGGWTAGWTAIVLAVLAMMAWER
jgi:hypothetical protein